MDPFIRSIDFLTEENAFFDRSRPLISTVVLGTCFFFLVFQFKICDPSLEFILTDFHNFRDGFVQNLSELKYCIKV